MKILYFFLFSFLFIACSTPVIHKNDVVAEVNGEQILLSELASQSKQEIFDILNTAYEIKSRVLAGLIKQKLLEDAAKKENMSLEEFIDWFVQQKICVGQDSLKKRYGFNTQSFYVKGELIPLVKTSSPSQEDNLNASGWLSINVWMCRIRLSSRISSTAIRIPVSSTSPNS